MHKGMLRSLGAGYDRRPCFFLRLLDAISQYKANSLRGGAVLNVSGVDETIILVIGDDDMVEEADVEQA